MKNGSITRFKLDPKKPPKTDWRSFDAMTEEERHRAALADPDAAPATEAQLQRASGHSPAAQPPGGGVRPVAPGPEPPLDGDQSAPFDADQRPPSGA